MTSYTVRSMADLPVDVFEEFDTINDHLQAAFDNYKAQLQRVYVTWSRQSELPTAVSSLFGPIITSHVDAAVWHGDHEKHALLRARAMMEHWLSVSPFLVVHDAGDSWPWLELGFRELEPPPTAQRPLRVFVYGDPPPLDDLFRTYRLSWEHPEWRFRDPEPPTEEMRQAIEALARRLSGGSAEEA